TEISGGDRIYQVHILPVKNERGEVFSGLMMTQDITESKQAEKALRSWAEEANQMNLTLAQTTSILEKRNSELDQFAYVVSHDLKAPLRAIANLSTWIEEDIEGQLTPETQRHMELLKGRVFRMESLINGLLQYSRVGRIQGRREWVDVQKLIEYVIEFLDPPAAINITIEPGMPTLETQPIPLQQVLSNLISNAIKHRDRLEGNIQISVQDLGESYEFAVADDGMGIAPEYHSKIFGIFQTLQPRDKIENTGVGLAIVKKIIEDRGGKIWISSELGQGTTFYFTWQKDEQEEGEEEQ
ncbi:MAG: sensor histidine kinase, partial [Chroococcales cyanobacterium]